MKMKTTHHRTSSSTFFVHSRQGGLLEPLKPTASTDQTASIGRHRHIYRSTR
jgi:hypothetical protein